MGRGALKGTRRRIDEERERVHGYIDQFMGERGESRGEASGAAGRLGRRENVEGLGDPNLFGNLDEAADFARGLMQSEGYSPGERSAILQRSLGSAGTAMDVARQRATRRLARTGNTAGYAGLISELGREEARTKAGLTQEAEKSFADRRLQENLAGLQGLTGIEMGRAGMLSQERMGRESLLSQERLGQVRALADLYGIDMSVLARAMGIPAQLLSARASASQGGQVSLGPLGVWG